MTKKTKMSKFLNKIVIDEEIWKIIPYEKIRLLCNIGMQKKP